MTQLPGVLPQTLIIVCGFFLVLGGGGCIISLYIALCVALLVLNCIQSVVVFITDNNTTIGLFCLAQGCANYFSVFDLICIGHSFCEFIKLTLT